MKRKLNLRSSDSDSIEPLGKREAAELRRRYADMRDPTRYVIVSPFSRDFCLYYRPGDGDFIMNHITPDTLFKRREEAVAVAKLVVGRRKKKSCDSLQVIAVRKTKRGILVVDEVTDPWHQTRKWKPIMKRDVTKA